jgi:hypothetical protein
MSARPTTNATTGGRRGVWAEARHAEAVHTAQLVIRAVWMTPTLIAVLAAGIWAVKAWAIPAAQAWADRQIHTAITHAVDSATPDLPTLDQLRSQLASQVRSRLQGGTR